MAKYLDIMKDNSIKFSPVKDRILQFIDYEGLNPNKFYIETGITRGVLTQGNGISERNISKFLDKYRKINPTWLITGKGEMFTEEEQSSAARVAEPMTAYRKEMLPNILEMNPESARTNTLIVDTHASAGFGCIVHNQEELQKLPSIHLPNAPHGLNIAFRIDGDSMHSTIRHMDFVAGNQITDVNNIRDGHTYIVVDNRDGILCKRIYRLGADWQFVSDNPVYPPYNRENREIQAFYRAFCRWSYDFHSYDDIRTDIRELKTGMLKIEALTQDVAFLKNKK